MTNQTYATSKEAYNAIHEGLSAAVSSMLEDCNYKEALGFADMMRELENNRMEIMTHHTMQGQTIKVNL